MSPEFMLSGFQSVVESKYFGKVWRKDEVSLRTCGTKKNMIPARRAKSPRYEIMTAGSLLILTFSNQCIKGSSPEARTIAVRTTRTRSFMKNKNQNRRIIKIPFKNELGVIFTTIL